MDLHWRNTQKPARFFALDARCFAFVMLFLVHARVWTLALAVLVIAIFWIAERRGLTFEAALRSLRSWIIGARRPGIHSSKRRHWTDFG